MLLRFLALPRAQSRLVLGLALFCIGTLACGKDPRAYISTGDKYAAESKWPEAILEYRNALQTLPQDGDLRLKLGEAYAKSGQGRLAAGEFIRAADLLSDRVDIQVRAGNIRGYAVTDTKRSESAADIPTAA